MNKKTTGIVAGAAGAALLIGGGTFALWNDSDSAPGATLTAGNLEVEFASGPTWRDVSDDRRAGPHDIDDISSFRLIPGDTLEATYDIKAALQGENLIAALEVEMGEIHNLPAEFIDASYSVYRGQTPVARDVDISSNTVEEFFSEDNPESRRTMTLPPTLPEEPNLRVVVTAKISEELPEETMQQAATFDGVDVSLSQVREGFGYRN